MIAWGRDVGESPTYEQLVEAFWLAHEEADRRDLLLGALCVAFELMRLEQETGAIIAACQQGRRITKRTLDGVPAHLVDEEIAAAGLNLDHFVETFGVLLERLKFPPLGGVRDPEPEEMH